MVRLLYNLLFKNSFGIWNKRYDKMFKELKKLIITEPIIKHFNLKKKTFIKYNSNNIIIKGILSQINDKR